MLRQIGIGRLILYFRLGPMPWDVTEHSLRLFADKEPQNSAPAWQEEDSQTIFRSGRVVKTLANSLVCATKRRVSCRLADVANRYPQEMVRSKRPSRLHA